MKPNSSKPDDSTMRQAEVFGRYIAGRTPSSTILKRYAEAIKTAPKLTSSEQKLLGIMLGHPWTVGCIDGALIFTEPHSELRHRLFLMFAVLEASPEFSSSFLPRKRSPFYIIIVGLVGLRAIIRTICGMLILKVVR